MPRRLAKLLEGEYLSYWGAFKSKDGRKKIPEDYLFTSVVNGGAGI